MNDVKQLEQWFDTALGLSATERAAFVAEKKAAAPELGQRLEQLLNASDETLPLKPDDMLTPGTISGVDQWLAKGIVGKRLGPYVLDQLLGAGGMGWVFLAHRLDHTEQQVAIKVLKSDLVDSSAADRFRAEAKSLAKLEHPNIARLIGLSVETQQLPYVVMEYVRDSQAILEYCDEHKLDIPQRLALFLNVCSAVEHAHQKLVVHCDIKSNNVLIDAQDQVKLIDFGIAKHLAEDVTLTQTGDRFVSPSSAAPEQLSGADLTVATDVYSLGSLLYRLICGRPTVDPAAKPDEIIRQILAGQIRSPSQQIDPQSPFASLGRTQRVELDAIVMKALRIEPDRRYRSVDRLTTDIQHFLAERPVMAVADSRWYRTSKFLHRHRWRTVAAAAAISIGLVYTYQQAAHQAQLRAERDRATAVADFMHRAFTLADPSARDTEQISARALVLAGAKELGSGQYDDPRLEFEMSVTMARSMMGLNMRQDVAPVLERANALWDQAQGSAMEGQWRLLVARAAFVDGDLDRAETELRIAEGLALEPSVKLGLRKLECDLISRQESEAAYGECTESLRDDAGDFGLQGADRYTAEQDWVDYLGLVGRTEESIEIGYRLAEEMESELRADHPSRIRSLSSLATHLGWAGRLQEDFEVTEGLLALTESAFGKDSRRYASALQKLAGSLAQRGDFETAQNHYQEAIAWYERFFGADHRQTGRVLFNAGSILVFSPQPERAIEYLRRSIAVMDASESDTRNQLLFRVPLGLALNRLGRHQEAEVVLRQSVTIGNANPDLMKYDFFTSAQVGLLVAESANEQRPSLSTELVELANSMYGTSYNADVTLRHQLPIAQRLGVDLAGLNPELASELAADGEGSVADGSEDDAT